MTADKWERSFSWGRWIAYFLSVILLLALVYWVITAAGLELIFPALGVKLWKLPIPGFAALQQNSTLRPLSLASSLSLLLMVFCLWSWDQMLKQYLEFRADSTHSRFNAEKAKRLILTLSIVILTFDGWAFYEGINAIGWGGSVFSFKAALATIGWMGILVAVTMLSIQLQPQSKKEE